MALNGTPWEQLYSNITYFALSPDGQHTAGAVQMEDVDSGEVHKFQEGAFSAAMDGEAWDARFVNVWNLAISPDGQHLAAEVRLNLYEYTIAVDGIPWETRYSTVWEPIFNPKTGRVVAPVRENGQWTLAEDGKPLWDTNLCSGLASIVQPGCKQACRHRCTQLRPMDRRRRRCPWQTTFSKLVTDAVFSPDGERIAALGKDDETFRVVVDGTPWSEKWDMIWKPVFSPNGAEIAAKVEKNGQYTYSVNNHTWSETFDAAWDPVFSPDGTHLMLRTVKDGSYIRRIIPVSTITG
jgi:WD40 repeat protein